MLFQGWAGSVLLCIFHSWAVPTTIHCFEQNSVTEMEYFFCCVETAARLFPFATWPCLYTPVSSVKGGTGKALKPDVCIKIRSHVQCSLLHHTVWAPFFFLPTLKLSGVVLPLVYSATWYIGHLCMLVLLQVVTVWMTSYWQCLCKGRAG